MNNELIYLLDLCTLAYQLHSQTLIWPMDPYYEQMSGYNFRRTNFMKNIFDTFKSNATYRGPGTCQDWDNNAALEPIISNYKRIYPWRPSFVRPDRESDGWIVYNAPRVITDKINVVKVAQYSSNPNKAAPQVVLAPLYSPTTQPPSPPIPNASDLLYCFEGGTGSIAGKTVASWSIMGFVLARELLVSDGNHVDDPYVVYIVFRGSRSGKLRPTEVIWDESGNPDWVSNMDFFTTVPNTTIGSPGSSCRGFATSMVTMLPTIMACLSDIQAVKGKRPVKICVAGHSLGGALACHFTSAVLRGTTYGPKGQGATMPAALKVWPWMDLKLVTFGAPIVGDLEFSAALDKTIVSRRVWLDGDVVTQERRHYMVGTPYRIPQDSTIILPSKSYHEPMYIRRFLIKDLLRLGEILDAPAATGNEDRDEPWKTFDTFQKVLDHLNYISGASFQPNISFPMDAGFYFYFSNLRRTLAAPNSFKYTPNSVRWFDNPGVVDDPPTQADLTLVRTNLTAIHDGLLDISHQNYPGPADRLKALRDIWIDPNMQKLKTIRQSTEASLYRFLGLGLFLSGFGKDAGAADSNIINQVPEFQALLKTI